MSTRVTHSVTQGAEASCPLCSLRRRGHSRLTSHQAHPCHFADLFDIVEGGDISAGLAQSACKLGQVVFGNSIVGNREEVDDDKSELIIGRRLGRHIRLIRLTAHSRKDCRLGLLGRSFLHLEQSVETAFLDGLEQRSGNVHMCIERVLSSSELGEGGDCRFEVGGVGREVTTISRLVIVAYICDTSLTSLTPVDRVISAASVLYLSSANGRRVYPPVQFRIDILSYLRERVASVLCPEEVLCVEIVGLFLQFAVLRRL